MAAIQIHVKVLDEKCATCQCLDISEQKCYSGDVAMFTEYYCANLHMCQFIRNRIVKNEKDTEENKNEQQPAG